MTAPPDDQLVAAIASVRDSHPDLGIAKSLALLKQQHPDWTVSEKRFRKCLAPKSDSIATALDPTVKICPLLEARLLEGRGKGLVAKEEILEGQVLWSESPWIVTASPQLYSVDICQYCFQLEPSRPVTCSHCLATFCNRLCLSRAKDSAHHDLLCPGRNLASALLNDFIRQHGARHVDAAARILARYRTEPDLVRQRIHGTARINQMVKESQRKEWPMVQEQRLAYWRRAHELVLGALKPKTLDNWWTFDTFLELLGAAELNQEDSGGLYAAHAHLNHSCEPNLQVRNLPKTFTPATPPCPLPTKLPRGTNKITILARRTIHPGEEVTISYVDLALDRETRRQHLWSQYGFWCDCPRCAREATTD